MKLKAANLKKVGNQTTVVASAIGGAALSRGASGLIPNSGIYGKIAIAGLAIFGAASISGTGTGADAAKGALIGMAIEQAGEVVIDAVQPVVAPLLEGESSALKEFGKRTVGLAGGYEYAQYGPAHETRGQESLGNAYANHRVGNALMIG